MQHAASMSKDLAQKYNLTAVDINTANAQFETGTNIRNMITYAVSITLLLVAGFGIYNILNMFIYEKMNDIAILKATGFSGKDVQQIFISQALIIGFAGGIVGLIIGYILSKMIAHTPFETEALPTIKTFPVNFDPSFYVIGITFAILSTFLAGYLPARKARKNRSRSNHKRTMMKTEKSVLEARNIQKYFSEPVLFHVLKDINLHLGKGEFVSIMGKSGCGKSTLLYILSTMDTDYEGELFLKGEKLTNKSQDELSMIRNKHIGFVFQFHYLLPEFTVLENVMLPAKKLGIKSIEEIEHDAIEKLRLLGIDDQAKKLSMRISGGQKQRVAIARALINHPSIIMGDEPTGNLDSTNSNNVLDIFKELSNDNGLSLLMVTHDMDFAKETDRIIQMSDGRIVSD